MAHKGQGEEDLEETIWRRGNKDRKVQRSNEKGRGEERREKKAKGREKW